MVSPLVQALTFQNSVNPAQSGIAPTDVVGSYKLASDAAEKNYQAKLAANNAMFGGLAGLGGAGIMAFGPSAAKSWFGQGASSLAPTATTGATSAVAPTAAAGGGIDAAAPLTFSGLPAGGAIDAGSTLGYSGLPAAFGGADVASAAAPTVAADLGTAAAAPTVAADLAGAVAPEAAAAGGSLLSSLPEWLLPLLFAA